MKQVISGQWSVAPTFRSACRPKGRRYVATLLFLSTVYCLLSACVAHAQTFQATHQAGNTYGANTDLSAVAATATHTSSPFPNAGYFKQAELYIIWSGTTGSPSGCTIQVKASGDATNFIDSGTAITVTPGTNAVSVFTGAIGMQVEYTYACATYPSAGTLTLESIYK
jgi:hypothetical protein